MPSLEQNRAVWGRARTWRRGGEEWSDRWGGPAAQWSGTILPRIASRLPADTILEIGAGYGRWSHFLLPFCSRLILVDLSERCVKSCRERFARFQNVECHVTDGRSLPIVAARSVDFAFSFDSLVHADPGVMKSYLVELDRILSPNGSAFLHHSNLGAQGTRLGPVIGRLDRLPVSPLRRILERARVLERTGWRDRQTSADIVAEACRDLGIRCFSQEIVNWAGKGLSDCFTTLDRSGGGEPTRIVNYDFREEIRSIRQAAESQAGRG